MLARLSRRFFGGVIFFALLVLVIAKSGPIISGNFDGVLAPATLDPSYQQAYGQLENWLASSPQGKVLFLPAYEGLPPKSNPSSFPDPLVEFPPRPPVTLQGMNYNQMTPFVINGMYLNRTAYAAKLLGLLGVRYVVVNLDKPDYNSAPYQNTSSLYHSLVDSQGLSEVWSQGPFHVFENAYYLGPVFASKNVSLAVGDRRIMTFLATLNSFPLEKRPLVFSDDLDSHSILNVLNLSNLTIIQGGNWEDLILGLSSRTQTIDPWQFATSTTHDYHTGWTTSSRLQDPYVWRQPYYLDLPFSQIDQWVFSWADSGQNVTMQMPFQIGSGDSYDVWAKIFVGYATFGNFPYLYQSNKLSFRIDDGPVREINEFKPSPGSFVWTKIDSSELAVGSHILQMTNLGGLSFVSKIALIPRSETSETSRIIADALSSEAMNVMYILEPQVTNGTAFDNQPIGQPPPSYSYDVQASYGIVAQSKQLTLQDSIDILKPGTYSLSIRAQDPENATLNVYVDGLRIQTVLVHSSNFDFYPAGTFQLGGGIHSLTVTAAAMDPVEIDRLILSSSDLPFRTLLDGQGTSQVPHTDEINPTQYQIMFASDPAPGIVVLNEPYHPLWEADTGAQSYDSIPVYSFANAFLVQSTLTKVTLVYQPQTATSNGYLVSIVVAVAAIAWVGVSKINKKRRHDPTSLGPQNDQE